MSDAPRYDNDELLKLVREERQRSIGFGEGDNGELMAARDKALRYVKGDMASDVPSLPGRSSVVDSTVADAIETVLPDIMEVFVGGEDVATFIPNGPQDEEAAQEETDYVQHVVFTENEGFLAIYTAAKDALTTRLGVIHWWSEDHEDRQTKATLPSSDPEMLEGVQAVAGQQGMDLEAEEGEDGSVALMQTLKRVKVCIKAVPSEDFTVAPDTVSLRDATYCAMRDRPRVQDLIARGIDAEKARGLPSYNDRNGVIEQDRDRAGESLHQNADAASGDLRTVEVRCHYIRLGTGEDGKLELWRVITDSQEATLLESEQVEQIPFAALTPYIVPHRFHGESVADKLLEVQRIKTVLLRNHLDSIYFGLNQRYEVADSGSNDHTIADLMRNEPGVPVRSKTGEAVRPISAGGFNVDVLGSLEYASTLAEMRSGIVRNAQGLNPDTLHDTAKGALALITAAQKRVRMIARIFAETGIKDLFLGVHAMLRGSYTSDHQPASAKLRNQWKEVRPNDWGERSAMAIHVGVGSAGKEHDLMVAEKRLEIAQEAAASGMPVVGPNNVHQALIAWERAAGSKAPDVYWTDPATVPPQPPKPSPDEMKAQADIQLGQAKAAADVQLAQTKAQSDAALQAQKHQNDLQTSAVQSQRDHELKLAQLQSEMELKRYQVDQELQLKREQLAAELELKRELGFAQANVTHEVGMAKVNASTSQVEPGGEPG